KPIVVPDGVIYNMIELTNTNELLQYSPSIDFLTDY
ncbi:unnamed protein product, partial [marine sediment metagenome]